MATRNKHIKLSILTFNTLGTPFFAPDIYKRYRKAAEIINNADIDIVCLQELFLYQHVSIFKKNLTNFQYCHFDKNIFGPSGGLAIFSKLPLVNEKFSRFTYPKKITIPFYTKIVQHGVLFATIEPFSIQIATSHLSSDTVHNLTPKNRLYDLIKSQSEQLADFINNNYKKDPLILTCDMNIAKHSTLHDSFLEKSEAIDVFEKDETPTYYPDRVSYFYKAPQGRCDYIFIKSPHNKFKIMSTGYAFADKEQLSNGDFSYLSDHIGLHCILEVNK
jgi:endonuclease/exonuclease/phosphatase family metal-dependent hydrolase